MGHIAVPEGYRLLKPGDRIPTGDEGVWYRRIYDGGSSDADDWKARAVGQSEPKMFSDGMANSYIVRTSSKDSSIAIPEGYRLVKAGERIPSDGSSIKRRKDAGGSPRLEAWDRCELWAALLYDENMQHFYIVPSRVTVPAGFRLVELGETIPGGPGKVWYRDKSNGGSADISDWRGSLSSSAALCESDMCNYYIVREDRDDVLVPEGWRRVSRGEIIPGGGEARYRAKAVGGSLELDSWKQRHTMQGPCTFDYDKCSMWYIVPRSMMLGIDNSAELTSAADADTEHKEQNETKETETMSEVKYSKSELLKRINSFIKTMQDGPDKEQATAEIRVKLIESIRDDIKSNDPKRAGEVRAEYFDAAGLSNALADESQLSALSGDEVPSDIANALKTNVIRKLVPTRRELRAHWACDAD